MVCTGSVLSLMIDAHCGIVFPWAILGQPVQPDWLLSDDQMRSEPSGAEGVG